jgi:hypothetical protein
MYDLFDIYSIEVVKGIKNKELLVLNVTSLSEIRINPKDAEWYKREPKMVSGTISDGLVHDKVEISPIGRELAVGAIEHQPAKYYGTSDINQSLNKILDGKDEKVSKAVYTAIGFNFFPDGNVSDEDERAALLEMGLSQARYIADNYMTGEEATDFLSTIDKIAAIAKTRTVDPITGSATYITPSERPQGAPDDYVSTGNLMKRFEPETYKKLTDAITSGGDWGSILLKFAEKVPQSKEWAATYIEERNQLVKSLKNTKIENRFKNADTSNMATFLEDVHSIIQDTSFTKKDFLRRNIEYFAHILTDKN